MKSKLQLKSDIAKVRKATGNAELREALEQVLTGIVDSLGTGKVSISNIIGSSIGASGDLAELLQAFVRIFEYDKKEDAVKMLLPFKNFILGNKDKVVTDIMRSIDEMAIDMSQKENAEYLATLDVFLPTLGYLIKVFGSLFLSRTADDVAEGFIEFRKGIRALSVLVDTVVETSDLQINNAAVFGQFVTGIVGGSGGRIDKDGNAELESLVLRSFLEVPELRFNRIDVVSGELWNSIAFGTIASVTVSNDGKGGTAWVHLEKTERCGLKVGDICRGIFSDFGDGKPKDENEDDNGFQKTYGFSTAYFTPTAIIRNEEGEFGFQYAIQAGTKVHPCAYMKFAVYGSFSDPSRRASAYFTRSYMRYLKNVQTWKINPDDNIASQFGNLDGLTIGGMAMKGEGTFLSNIYMTGAVIQFSPEQKKELMGQDAYSVVLSDYECVIHVNSDGNVRDMTKVRQVVATDGNVMAMKDGKPVSVVDLGYNATAAVQVHKGQTLMHHAPMVGALAYTIVPVFSNCEGFVANGVLTVTRIIDVEAGAYVDLEINCEGNAVFSKHYAISVVHDAADSFTQFVFKRTNDDEVAKPEGGSYASPLPDGWSDGVPAGEAKLWMSRRKFTSDGKNQDDDWSTPRPMSDTADFDVCFHDAVAGDAAPSAPPKDMHPTQTGMSGNNGWYDDGKTTSEWMAMATCSNGVWSDWSVVKIVGESPVIADIDNEMDGIGVGSDGILDVATSTSTNVCMYHGAKLMQIRSVSVSGLPSGVTASTAYPSSSDHSRCTVTFNISSGTNFSTTNRYAITLTIVATYNDVDYTRTLTYTLLGTTNGKDGEVYYLQPSTTAVKRNKDLIYSPSSVTCTRYVKRGKSDAVASNEGELTMSTDGGSTWDPYATVSKFSGISSIIYRWKINGVEVDRETVPVISDGIDGKSNVIADIDNEMDSIITDVDGNFSGSVALYANVSMWYGATKLTLDEITFSSVTGVTSSGNKSTGKCTFSVTSSMSDKAVISITVKATHNGTQYVRTLTFTISKVKQGSKGENAIVYAIKTSVSAVKVDKSGNVYPSSVSASVTKTEGGSTQNLSSLISGMSLQSSKNGSSWSNNPSVDVSKSDTQVYFRLMLNGVEIDHETVPVVIDGVGIKNVTKYYALSTSKDSVTGIWGPERPTMTSIDRYLWCYEKITYTDGSTQITDPIIIGVYGEEGKPGLQGLIVRTGEWVSGAYYRCDEGVDCGFLDVVLIKNDSAETGWDAYKCIKEHPSSSSNSPTSSSSSTYWQYMSNIGALFTSLIIAKNAKLMFAQANQLLLENDDATPKVTGGLSGGGGIQIWAGSDGMSGNTPNNPKFYVTSQGEMYAKNGVFEGSIKTKFTSGNDAVNFDKISGTANTIILPNGSGNVGREVTIYNSAFNQTRVPSETIIKVNGSGNIMGAKVKGDNSFGSVSDQSQYANQIHFWGGIVKLIALPNTSTTCLWMVMFVNVEGGYYIYADSSGSWVYQKDINDASSVNGLRLASGTTAGDNDNTIYFVTE